MTFRLLLDEHYAEAIAAALRTIKHDVVAAVSNAELRGMSDPELFRHATETDRRIVTENIKDFRPLLLHAIATGSPAAPLLLVPPRRFPRGRGDRTSAIVTALRIWLDHPDAIRRPVEDWLIWALCAQRPTTLCAATGRRPAQPSLRLGLHSSRSMPLIARRLRSVLR